MNSQSRTAAVLDALIERLGGLTDDELVTELRDLPLAVRRELASGALSLRRVRAR